MEVCDELGPMLVDSRVMQWIN